MFGIFTDAIESTLNVADDLLNLEAPSKRDIAKMADAGLTVAAIASATGFAEETITNLLED